MRVLGRLCRSSLHWPISIALDVIAARYHDRFAAHHGFECEAGNLGSGT